MFEYWLLTGDLRIQYPMNASKVALVLFQQPEKPHKSKFSFQD